MVPDLDLDLLRCFLTVSESSGFTLAAKRLGLSQSAVSMKIQRLESLLGVSLFTRSSRSLRHTDSGELVLGYARRLLALNQEMMERLAEPVPQGRLRLGVVQQFGQQMLPRFLALFKKAHPQVQLSVETGMSADLMAAIGEGEFDVVVAASGMAPGPALEGCPFTERDVILREPMVWAQAAASTLNLKTRPLPLVLLAATCHFRRVAQDLLERAHIPWEAVYSSASLASVQAAVQADLGIAAFSRSCLQPGMRALSPSRLGLPALPEASLSLYCAKSAPAGLVDSLAEFVFKAVAGWQERRPRAYLAAA